MKSRKINIELVSTVREWTQIGDSIRKAIGGLTEAELDVRGGPNNWSIREIVHHLVEANLIASNIIIAALANSGSAYDWSWVNPDRAWMKRLSYNKAPIEPALATLLSLSQYLQVLMDRRRGALNCEIKLLDAPGARLRTVSVEEVLQEEIKHAQEHLREVEEAHARLVS